MTDLEEREDSFDRLLRAAGVRLRDHVARSAVPAFHVPRRSHRRRWVIVMATAAAVIVGLVAIGTNRNDQSLGNDPARLRWLLKDLPDDLPLVAVLDPVTQIGATDAPYMSNVYASNAAPLGPLLAVRGSLGRPEMDLVPGSEGTNFTELTIDGRRAVFADGSSGQRLLFIETGGHWVSLHARNLDDAALEVLAKSAVRADDGTASIPTAALVQGLQLAIGADAPIDPLFGGPDVGGVDYASPDGRSVSLRVSFSRLSTRALAGLEAPLTPTTIAGASGFVGNYTMDGFSPARQMSVVSWERDGLYFTIRGVDVPQAVVLAAATSVEGATDAGWADLLKATGYGPGSANAPAGTTPAEPAPPGTDPPFTDQPRDVAIDVSVSDLSDNEQVWSGTLPTGEPWRVRVTRVYDYISIRPELDGHEQGWSYGPLDRAPGQEIGCCPPNVVTANPAAASLRILRSNGDRYVIPLHDLPGDGGLRAAFISVSSSQTVELIDADGNILERSPVGG